MKIRKLMMLLLVCALIVSMLSACSKDKETEGDTSSTNETTVNSGGDNPEVKTDGQTGDIENQETAEAVEVKLGIWPEDTNPNEVELHEQYKATLEAKSSNVTIIPDNYKYATDTFISLAETGNLPTIFETWFTEPQKLIRGGFVKDITDLLDERGWLDAMNPSIRGLLSDENGRVYGLPRDGYALGLMINVEMFEEAGLVNDDGTILVPKTWDDVAEMSLQIKEATGMPGLCLLAKDNAGGWHFSNIAWSFGADLCVEDANGKFIAQLNSPEAIAAMQFVKDLRWTYDVLTPDPTNEDWGTGFVNLGTGTAAMYIGANDAVNQPTETNGLPVDKLALVAMPAGPGGQYSLSGGTPYMFSEYATDDEVRAALDYLEIMGKAPVVTDDSLAGMRADAEYRVNAGIPVIPRFPAWTNDELIKAEEDIITEYNNIDMALFDSYFTATRSNGNLKLEEEGMTQDMYAELTKVLQAVVIDKNADVEELMNIANDNYQTILDSNINR